MDVSNHRSRGGKGGAEPRARILTRRWRAWELSVQGRTQREIANTLNVSQSAVSKMVSRAAAEAGHEFLAQIRDQLARQASQFDHVYRESLDAWEKSKVDQTRRRHRRIEPGAGTGAGAIVKTVAEAVATTREGDPRFLAVALQALREKRDLLIRMGVSSQTPLNPPDNDEWAKLRQFLTTLTDEELVIMRQVAYKRLTFRPAFDLGTQDLALQSAIDEVRGAPQRAAERPTAAGTPLPPSAGELRDDSLEQADTSADGA